MPIYTLEPVARAICAAAGYTFGGGIGQGTFKETYLATKADGTKLALKVLRPGFSPERSDREVDAMKRCSHPNIVTLLELAEFEHAGAKYGYLVEGYLGGGTLDDRMQRNLLSRGQVQTLGDELIRAVAHIADQDLVHRDFKPTNIMYPSDDAEAVVVDFGIVRDLKKESITKSYLLSGPGTPFFAAPEQLNNEKALIDWRTDQFAIGVTLALAHFGFIRIERTARTTIRPLRASRAVAGLQRNSLRRSGRQIFRCWAKWFNRGRSSGSGPQALCLRAGVSKRIPTDARVPSSWLQLGEPVVR